ncbi:MAG: TM2 domain-containing protein [Negativicoccus succinicivorans]|nr:TM2 domain protein [Anaerococcus hydrogenalis]MDU5914754.1 TM2 domain-containing protein [Negativicoccus succinicivorans]
METLQERDVSMDENNRKSEQVNAEVDSSVVDDVTAKETESQAEPVEERIIERTTIIKEVPVNKGVNRVVYILLAFFFGTLGVHRFYAGHAFAGICYLLCSIIGWSLTWFLGIGFIILGIELIFCLYDIVRAAFATADEHGQIHV